MQDLPVEQTRQVWRTWWEGAEQEVLKVGVLQDYSEGMDGQNPSLQLWLDGDVEASRAAIATDQQLLDYADMLRERRAAGVAVRRIDYVEEPQGPYMQWMHESLRQVMVPAGEELLRVGPEDVADLTLPEGDVVVFDNEYVVVYKYEGLGRLVGAEVYSVQEGDDLTPFLSLKDTLLERAQPLTFPRAD